MLQSRLQDLNETNETQTYLYLIYLRVGLGCCSRYSNIIVRVLITKKHLILCNEWAMYYFTSLSGSPDLVCIIADYTYSYVTARSIFTHEGSSLAPCTTTIIMSLLRQACMNTSSRIYVSSS